MSPIQPLRMSGKTPMTSKVMDGGFWANTLLRKISLQYHRMQICPKISDRKCSVVFMSMQCWREKRVELRWDVISVACLLLRALTWWQWPAAPCRHFPLSSFARLVTDLHQYCGIPQVKLDLHQILIALSQVFTNCSRQRHNIYQCHYPYHPTVTL